MDQQFSVFQFLPSEIYTKCVKYVLFNSYWGKGNGISSVHSFWLVLCRRRSEPLIEIYPIMYISIKHASSNSDIWEVLSLNLQLRSMFFQNGHIQPWFAAANVHLSRVKFFLPLYLVRQVPRSLEQDQETLWDDNQKDPKHYVCISVVFHRLSVKKIQRACELQFRGKCNLMRFCWTKVSSSSNKDFSHLGYYIPNDLSIYTWSIPKKSLAVSTH